MLELLVKETYQYPLSGLIDKRLEIAEHSFSSLSYVKLKDVWDMWLGFKNTFCTQQKKYSLQTKLY